VPTIGRVRSVSWLPVPLVLLAACLSTAGSGALLRNEIRDATRRLEERFRTGDLLGVADAYADDALLIGPGGLRIEGRKEIDAYWSRIEEPIDWRLDVREIGGEGNLAYEIGTSRLTTVWEGEEQTSVVEFLLVWRRDEGGEWRIAVDTYWAPDAPPSPGVR